MRIKPSKYIILGIISSIIFLNSCGKNDKKIEIDLTAYFHQLPVLPEVQSVDFSESSSKNHYDEGWFPVKTEEGSQFSRTEENSASLKFFFHSPKSLSLSARFRSNQPMRIESQWNGFPLPPKQFEKGKTEIKWELNSDLMRSGINRIDFNFIQTDPDSSPKIRIDILDVSFSSLSIDPEPELSISETSQTIKMLGPFSLVFFLRTYHSSSFQFDYRCPETLKESGSLKISISSLNEKITEKNITLSSVDPSKWRQEKINLSEYDDQLIRIEIQHLNGYAGITEIRKPLLKGSILASRKKVILLGVDGAAWEVINPLIAQGQLPHFKHLIDSGSSGRLRSVLPMYSPVIWTSIVTGKTKEKHGISGFVEQNQNEDIIPNSRLNRRCLTLWNILSDEQRITEVIGPWVTWPAEKVNGFLLTDHIYFRKLQDTIFPREFIDVWTDLNDSMEQQPEAPLLTGLLDLLETDIMNSRSPVLDNITQEKKYLEQDYLKNKIGYILHSFLDPDFYFLYLRAPDVSSHFFWKYYQPDDTVLNEEIDRYGQIIPSVYTFVDALIGQQLEQFSENSYIIVVSDHGMGPKSYASEISFNKIDRLWQQLGIQKNILTSVQKRFRISLSFSTAQASRDASSTLKKVVFGSKKQPFFKIQESENPKILILELSDIYHPNGSDEIFFNGQTLGRLNDYVSIQEISGDHILHGILIMKGPSIKSGYRLKDYSVLDIAPTILALLDLPVPRDMDGDVIKEALLPGYRKNNSIPFIDTYEKQDSKTLQDTKKPKMDSDSKKEILERLRSLGYIK